MSAAADGLDAARDDSKLTDPHFALCAGLLTACFGATGTLFNIAKRATNDGKVGIGAPFLAVAPR